MSAQGPTQTDQTWAPLAERMRPMTLDEFVGQRHLLGPGKLLHSLLAQGRLTSLILWGPPGSGKTTLGIPAASSSRIDQPFGELGFAD